MNDAITPEEIQAGFLQVVVSKATAADSDEATNLSSAVASDTTLGLLARVRASLQLCLPLRILSLDTDSPADAFL